jgi:uncharacterized protein (TIGR02145 family)
MKKSKLTLTTITMSLAFSTAFAGTFSKSCIEEVMNLSEEDGFDMQDFIKELLPVAIKVKAQAKAPLQFLLGPGPDNKVTDIGLTVGCLKALPESPREIKSLLMNAGLEMGKSVAAGKSVTKQAKTAIRKDDDDENYGETDKSGKKDSRDDRTYKTVKIGSQIWMAENLNYNTTGSKCYDNKTENCDKHGRLYDWQTAKKACPSSWHLPTNAEWDKLIAVAGDDGAAGKYLKTKSGWSDSGKDNLDRFGFSALPSGYGILDGGFSYADIAGYWWSSSEHNSKYAYGRNIFYNTEKVSYNYYGKSALFSVRCVKD